MADFSSRAEEFRRRKEELDEFEKELKKPRAKLPFPISQMEDEQIPWIHRGYCAHLYPPLAYCIKRNFYAPWACSEEKHSYKDCLYKERSYRARWVFLLNERVRLHEDMQTARGQGRWWYLF